MAMYLVLKIFVVNQGYLVKKWKYFELNFEKWTVATKKYAVTVKSSPNKHKV